MSKKFQYSIPEMTRRLLHIAAPVKGTLLISTLASITGNLSQMGLMGFGAMLLLTSGKNDRRIPSFGTAALWFFLLSSLWLDVIQKGFFPCRGL